MRFLRRLRYVLDHRRLEAELARELEAHRAMRQAELERSGLPPREAADASRRALGNVTLAREDARAIWVWPALERVWHDVRHGTRVLRGQPTFALTAILTLAIGVAATTTVLSVVEAEIWRPLPFPRPERLVSLSTSGIGRTARTEPVSGPDFIDWRTAAQSYEELAAFLGGGNGSPVLSGPGLITQPVSAAVVTPNFLRMLQLTPALGRSFAAVEDAGARAVILADATWRKLFGANPSVVGTSIALDGRSYAIVGVMAPEARLEILEDDLFMTLDLRELRDRNARDLWAIGRLKDGVDASAAGAELQSIAARLAREYPASHGGRSAHIKGLREAYTFSNWRALYFFLGAGVFLLLLSSANVASLVLARALARQREFAIRGALGGGQRALARQLIVEGALLAVPGAGVGLVLTIWLTGILPSWLPSDYLYRAGSIAIDRRVFVFTLLMSACTALVFGLAPAAFATRRDLSSVLGQGSRSMTASPRQQRARYALVVGEITMALVLLFGAGLFLNSFIRLTRLPLGFDPDNRLTMRLSLIGDRYRDAREVRRFQMTLIEAAQALPGVRLAVAGTSVPLGSGQVVYVAAADRPLPEPGKEARTIVRGVSPRFFEAFGIRRLAGREFTREDAEGAPRVAVINENTARQIFPGADPIGKELLVVRTAASWVPVGTVTVVGVVSNIKDVGINEIDFNDLYLPLAQHRLTSIQLVASTSVPAENVVETVRQLVHRLDSNIAVGATMTMAERVNNAFREDRFNLIMIGTFAALALMLAAVGIYGTMAYSIEQRTREFGVRIALGARRTGILSLALGQSARLGAAGTALGLAASLVIGRLLGSALYMVPTEHNGLLYGVSVADPLTLTCASIALMATVLAAALVPARRATRVDPIAALRCD